MVIGSKNTLMHQNLNCSIPNNNFKIGKHKSGRENKQKIGLCKFEKKFYKFDHLKLEKSYTNMSSGAKPGSQHSQKNQNSKKVSYYSQ